MKKTLSLLVLCCVFLTPALAQYTVIPDANFEQALIDFGVDSEGTLDGQMLTSDAASQSTLSIINRSVTDFTGIEAFVNITALDVSYNDITSLNTSFNTLVESINTEGCTVLTALNLSSNTALTTLNLFDNDLSTLDLSNNLSLETIDVRFNQITSLDLSNHTALTSFNAKNNELTFLDMRNGNNASITFFDSDFNINLQCIFVDDASAAYHSSWTISFYSTLVNNEAECNTLSQDEVVDVSSRMYYNSGLLYVDSINQGEILEVYNTQGRLVAKSDLYFGKNSINVKDLDTGIYIIKISSINRIITKKVVFY